MMNERSENQGEISNDIYTNTEESHGEPSQHNVQPTRRAIDNENDNDSALSSSVSFQTAEDTQYAVQLKNVKSTYGFGKQATHVLRGVNLDVPEGVIYGLLGPSGCGKTTLLKCIVGHVIPKEGSVLVFGSKPGSKTSCVPGRGIGYMPQELALYEEFSIKEILVYFGRIQKLSTDFIKERRKFLLKFLDLPEKGRLIKNLSGGQQRRVSLAAALIHQPPLLVLDEPTVGVDPLLRESLWNYFVTLTTKENMTVLITTHYIDEAIHANIVGLMRNGRIMAEDSPTALMQITNQLSLEDVFLQLCKAGPDDNTEEGRDSHLALQWRKELEPSGEQTEVDRTMRESTNSMSTSAMNLIRKSISKLTKGEEIQNLRNASPSPVASSLKSRCEDSLTNIAALFNKNITMYRRNPLILMFTLLFPSIQVTVLLLCVGNDPSDLGIAVFNEENPLLFSKLFLDNIDNKVLLLKTYNNLRLAKSSVEDGINWGVLHIGDSFSGSLLRRYHSGLEADNSTIDASTIRIYLDMSNQQIGYIIQKTILDSFLKFVHDMLKSNGTTNTAVADLPVSIEKPIYGKRKLSFSSFVAPAFILSCAFFRGTSAASLLLVDDKVRGVVHRSWVSGVTYLQIFIGHVFSAFILIITPSIFLLMTAFLIFNVQLEGSILLISVITLLQSQSGVAYGFLISAICNNKRTAVFISQGSIVLFLNVCGIMWPVEAMPSVVRYISYCFPQTLPVEAARGIMGRGWDLTQKVVWSGYLVTIAWIIIPNILSAIIFSKRR